MLSYFLKRFGLMLVTFIVTIFIIFLFIKAMPDNVMPNIGIDDYHMLQRIKREGWDKPHIVQFGIWVRNIFQNGYFGFSYVHRQDVGRYYFSKMPATIRINLFPYFLSIPPAIALGILAALYKNKWVDNLISIGIIVFISVPYFVVISLTQYFLYFKWKIIPDYKVATPSEFLSKGTWYGITTYIMPVIVLTITSIPSFARTVRAELTEQLTQDYILLARSKGLTKKQATYRHALKNALVPFLPGVFLGIVGIISGGIVTERLFRVDGTGRLYLDAFNSAPPDYAMIMLISAFSQFIGLLSSIITDMSYTLFDPRMRVGSGKLAA